MNVPLQTKVITVLSHSFFCEKIWKQCSDCMLSVTTAYFNLHHLPKSHCVGSQMEYSRKQMLSSHKSSNASY